MVQVGRRGKLELDQTWFLHRSPLDTMRRELHTPEGVHTTDVRMMLVLLFISEAL